MPPGRMELAGAPLGEDLLSGLGEHLLRDLGQRILGVAEDEHGVAGDRGAAGDGGTTRDGYGGAPEWAVAQDEGAVGDGEQHGGRTPHDGQASSAEWGDLI